MLGLEEGAGRLRAALLLGRPWGFRVPGPSAPFPPSLPLLCALCISRCGLFFLLALAFLPFLSFLKIVVRYIKCNPISKF